MTDTPEQEPKRGLYGDHISKVPDPADAAKFQAYARKLRLPKSQMLAQRRIDELTHQIGRIKPLLDSNDESIRLRASEEIRNLDEAILKWYQHIAEYKPTKKPYLKKTKLKRAQEARAINVFRPT